MNSIPARTGNDPSNDTENARDARFPFLMNAAATAITCLVMAVLRAPVADMASMACIVTGALSVTGIAYCLTQGGLARRNGNADGAARFSRATTVMYGCLVAASLLLVAISPV